MIQTLAAADRDSLSRFEAIIDVRSPAEFAEDHLPTAINLPVLEDAERALVGTIYVQRSRFEARRVGAAIVARNIAQHLDGALASQAAGYAPLVYCWRGGQRSAAMATVLDQVGWRPTLLAGGYKTYRRAVCERLRDVPPRIVLLSGHTGTAKTAILLEAQSMGAQIIDLEGLAQHRGSLLGNVLGLPQPSQKMFESRLAAKFASLNSAKPVLIEAESSKIGSLNIPEMLWKAMAQAPMFEVRSNKLARAHYLISAYRDLVADSRRFMAALERLPGRHGRAALEEWLRLARDGSNEALAIALIEIHYDPAYARWDSNHPRQRLQTFELEDLTDQSITAVARRIVDAFKSMQDQ